jgi:hypothetical protein
MERIFSFISVVFLLLVKVQFYDVSVSCVSVNVLSLIFQWPLYSSMTTCRECAVWFLSQRVLYYPRYGKIRTVWGSCWSCELCCILVCFPTGEYNVHQETLKLRFCVLLHKHNVFSSWALIFLFHKYVSLCGSGVTDKLSETRKGRKGIDGGRLEWQTQLEEEDNIINNGRRKMWTHCTAC